MHAHAHTHMYTHAHTHMYTHACTHTHTYTQHMHTHNAFTHTHAQCMHTHTHTLVSFPFSLTLQGGLVAADVGEKRQELFTGLILSAPGLESDPQPGPFLVGLLNLKPL